MERNKWIKELLFFSGIAMMFSGFLWMLTASGPMIWFSRHCAGLIFLGLSALIKTE